MASDLKWFAGVAVAVLVLQGVAAGQGGLPEHVPDELLVKFTPGSSDQSMATVEAQLGLEPLRVFRLTGIRHVRIRSGLSVPEALARLTQHPVVAYAEPNYIRRLGLTPNDPQYPNMWGLNNVGQTGGSADADIDAPEAWNIVTGSPSVVVAVIDSGMDLQHQDLAANLWTNPFEVPGNGIDDDGNGFVDDVHGWDFRGNDNDPTDTSALCSGHGTHTAGTVGAVGNNGIGVVGVNWRVTIMPLRVFGGLLCTGRDSDIMAAIEYYTGFGVRLSNNSYSGSAFNQAVMDTIRASHSIFAAAAGNSGSDNDTNPEYPASYALGNIIAVAATDHNDTLASFSNFGATSVDLAAPGVNILSTLPGNAYGLLSGTSMATPHVAGAAALLLARDPALTDNEVRWRLLKGGDFKGLPVLSGARLNVRRALDLQTAVTVAVMPLGSQLVHRGDVVQYQVTVTNLSGVSQVVTRVLLVRHPDGNELMVDGPSNLVLAGGASTTQVLSLAVPAGAPANLNGANRLVGRVFTAGFNSFDEDEVLYLLLP